MRLRNTETKAIQPLEPHSDPVRLYVCGITPYDTTHLGHAFTYVVFDVLVGGRSGIEDVDGAPVSEEVAKMRKTNIRSANSQPASA